MSDTIMEADCVTTKYDMRKADDEETDEEVSAAGPISSTYQNKRRHRRRGKKSRRHKQGLEVWSWSASELSRKRQEEKPRNCPAPKETKRAVTKEIQKTDDKIVDANSAMLLKKIEVQKHEKVKGVMNNKGETSGDVRGYSSSRAGHRRHHNMGQRQQQRWLNKSNKISSSNNIRTQIATNYHRGNRSKRMLILRPNRGHLMNAPRNSTQFIMHDHEEGSPYVLRASKQPHGDANNQTGDVADEHSAHQGCFQKSPYAHSNSCDDDTYWAEYVERDFQTVYELAQIQDESRFVHWDKPKLIEEIGQLEKRHTTLVNKLSQLDPEMHFRRLQSRLARMQQRNSKLLRHHRGQNPCPENSKAVMQVLAQGSGNEQNEAETAVDKIEGGGSVISVECNVEDKNEISSQRNAGILTQGCMTEEEVLQTGQNGNGEENESSSQSNSTNIQKDRPLSLTLVEEDGNTIVSSAPDSTNE